jgi:hypothetical protein
MSFWKVSNENKPEKVSATKLKNENILEKHLEDWISSSPDILGERILLIGRQVFIPEVKDKIDLLGLDINGKAVIIELKRGKLSDPVDMQALRYASYISKWEFEDFESHAKAYMTQPNDFNFNDLFETFCQQSGVDEIPDINNDQRIIIVGSEVREKLGTVALWLFEHNVDIKIIEIETYKEGDTLLLQPKTIVPLELNRFSEVGKAKKSDLQKPWLTSGKSWHLEKRLNASIKERYLTLENLIKENIPVEGPTFEQKNYISFKQNGFIWLAVRTFANFLVLQFSIKQGSMSVENVAKKLSVEIFDKDDSLSEKLNLPSSVNIKNRNQTTDRMILRIKDDFKLEKPEFLEFLIEASKNSSRG